jgi:hypothetical protein
MSDATSFPVLPPRSLSRHLALYVLWWLCLAALIAPFARPDSPGSGGLGLYRLGLAAWSAHVLVLAAVLMLSVPSLVVGFKLALLAVLLQGYLYMAVANFWLGSAGGGGWDDRIQLSLVLGLAATLSAVVWLVVRVVWKLALSPEAAEGAGRSGQLGLRELLYIMASLSALLAFISLFSLPGVIPVEQVLSATAWYLAQIGPLTLLPFWLAVHRRAPSRHLLWIVPLTLLCAACVVAAELRGMAWWTWDAAIGTFVGIVFGTIAAVTVNAAALRMLGLSWCLGGVNADGARPALL